MTHILTLQSITPVTHNTNHLVFERPSGFDFTPGQACELNLLRDGWTDEKRPFTFTSFPDAPTLEFVIKSYPDHDGVTEQIATLQRGDQVEITDPWGAIEDKGAGVFLAGGAGITPFIPILRNRHRKGEAAGCALHFSNKTEADIILREEWDAMHDLATTYVLSGADTDGFEHGQIDRAYLEKHVDDLSQVFYVCGPDPMVEALSETLSDMGVPDDRIVTEE